MSVLTRHRPTRTDDPGASGEQHAIFAVATVSGAVTGRLPIAVGSRGTDADRLNSSENKHRGGTRFDSITWEIDRDLRYADMTGLAIKEEHMAIADVTRTQLGRKASPVCRGEAS